MTPEEIKRNAPHGATHYFCDTYYKYNYVDGWYIYMFGIGWVKALLGINTKPKPL